MDKVFHMILNMSLTGAFAILIVMLARIPLKKAPKIISYCLWAVVGFRLVFPFTIESPVSLMPFETVPVPAATTWIDRPYTYREFIEAPQGTIPESLVQYPDDVPLTTYLIEYCGYAWLIGAAAMMIYGIVSFVRLKRGMRSAIRRSGNIYETDAIHSPFVLGVFKPNIYLPFGLAGQEREYIVLHEQTHIKRRDHIVKFGAYFILCLHWFNPLAWAAFVLMGVDMEMSCDESVLKQIGDDTKKDYSLSLLSMSGRQRMVGGSPLAFSEGGLKARIKNVLNFRKPSRVIVALAIALTVALSVGFAANRGTDERPLIEMQIIYEKNPASFYSDMKLVWGSAVYHLSPMTPPILNAERGKQIGYATDETSTWGIYELKGYELTYLYAVEDSTDAWRVMSSVPQQAPYKQYVLENATNRQRMERMLSVTLYHDGSARLSTPPISSYAMVYPLFYTFSDNELIIHYESGETVAIFDVIDENTVAFKSATSPLFADTGARYVDTQTPSVPNTYLPSIMHDGILYALNGNGALNIEFELTENQPTILSTVPLTEVPTENGQANFNIEIGAPYGRHEYGLAVLWNDAWMFFVPFERLNDSETINPFDPDIRNQVYLGMTNEEVYASFGEPDYQASGLMWYGYDEIGTFNPSGLSPGGVVDSISLNDGTHWAVWELINAAVIQHNDGKFYAPDGVYPTVSYTCLALDANKNSFTAYIVALYRTFLPDGEYDAREVGGIHSPLALTFAKNLAGEYELTEYWEPENGTDYISSIRTKFPQNTWDKTSTQLYIETHSQRAYEQAIYHFVGAMPYDTRIGIRNNTSDALTISGYAEVDVVEERIFLVKYFPGATMQIEPHDESNNLFDDGRNIGGFVIEYADSSKNIAVGPEGTGAIPITDDMIGIYNTIDIEQHIVRFEKYIPNSGVSQ